MTDIRKIEVEKTIRTEYLVDVDKWFDEFSDVWADFEQDKEGREEFIKDQAHELAGEDSLHFGAIEIYDGFDDIDLNIWKVKP